MMNLKSKKAKRWIAAAIAIILALAMVVPSVLAALL